jgi:hypothetical protein
LTTDGFRLFFGSSKNQAKYARRRKYSGALSTNRLRVA